MKEIEPNIPYLDKFSVKLYLVAQVWEQVYFSYYEKYPKFIWRSSLQNPHIQFYYKYADAV